MTVSAAGLGQLGRAPISYFAPDPAFAVATDTGAAARELKQVISGLHDAGLEAILQARTSAFCLKALSQSQEIVRQGAPELSPVMSAQNSALKIRGIFC